MDFRDENEVDGAVDGESEVGICTVFVQSVIVRIHEGRGRQGVDWAVAGAGANPIPVVWCR